MSMLRALHETMILSKNYVAFFRALAIKVYITLLVRLSFKIQWMIHTDTNKSDLKLYLHRRKIGKR